MTLATSPETRFPPAQSDNARGGRDADPPCARAPTAASAAAQERKLAASLHACKFMMCHSENTPVVRRRNAEVVTTGDGSPPLPRPLNRGDADRKRRAAFCRLHGAPGGLPQM